MAQPNVQVQQHNAEEWSKLDFLLQNRRKPTIIWMSSETFPLQLQSYQTFTQRYKSYQHEALSLESFADSSLERFIGQTTSQEANTSEEGTFMIHLFDLDRQLIHRQEEEVPVFLYILNFERELLFRDFNYFLVFWTSPRTQIQVQRHAPDFWDWVAYKFEFLSEVVPEIIPPTEYRTQPPNP